jgi:hypothetical protein
MNPGRKILAVEQVIQPGNAPFFGKWLDVHMLVLLAGPERTEEEYRTLFESAEFELTRVIATACDESIVEGVRR